MLTRVGLLLLLLTPLPTAADDATPPSLTEVLQHDFSVVTLEGSTVPLATLLASGRPVVLEFWATWCPPCRKSLPDLEKVKERYGDRLAVLGLTVEEPESAQEKVHRFVEDHHLTFKIAFAPAELFQFMNNRMDIAVPKLFVFDGGGALIRYIPRHSPATSRKLRMAVAELLD